MTDLISSKVIKLVYNAYDLEDLVKDLDFDFKPHTDQEEKFILQAELDALYAHLYKINEKDLKYILESFSRLKKMEKINFGEFKTKNLVLNAFKKFSKQKELFE